MIVVELEGNITENFKWKEALFLYHWNIHVFPTPEEIGNILKTAEKLEKVRRLLGNRPIKVNSWLRPVRYNAHIGGANKSAHIEGLAVDFKIEGVHSNVLRGQLKNHLDELGIRMEKLGPFDNWVHIDLKEPGPSGRYFNP